MFEKKLQVKMRRTAVLVACSILLFLVCGGLLSTALQKSKSETIQEQISIEIDEYKSRILKQLDADFQMLSTLAAFLEENITEDRQLLTRQLDQANQNNGFLTMVYFDRQGQGVISTLGEQPLTDASLDDLTQEGRRVVELALEGTVMISQLFESELSENRVFAYSVPVYSNGKLIGALAASDHIDIFSDILNGNAVLSGGGYIHMLDSEGNFLVRSSRTVLPAETRSLFDSNYLSEEARTLIQNALQNQQSASSSFSYQGKTYPFMVEPVGLNGWMLLCVSTGETISTSTSDWILQGTFIGVFLLMLFLLLYNYRILRGYNRELIGLAYYDTLTQAENLTRFQQRLPEALEHTGGCVAALCVRQFPFLIEIFGRDKAEQLLCQMKKTADQLLKKDEFFCRDTEDRFYLFLAETDQETLRPRLQQLMDQICAQAEISAMNYQLALYCGVAISEASDHPAEMANTLMVRVQFALDKAIGGHSNTIWFFDTELHKLEELENYIESHMHQALHSGEFRMFLQPKHRLSDGKLLGAEALVRWLPRDRGPIFPDQFIPLFEKNGFCVQLDLYMVEQACRKLREWMDRGMTPVPLSVNQSKLLFFEADYVGKLTRIVDRYQISPQWITLEILEGMALENADVLNRKIADLHQAGFQISLDDFGSGYSSLNTLGKLEIDELKLDREFLLSASSPKQNRVRLIMEQIVQLAHQLTIRTVVEGVETEEDERFIRSIGCDIGQGYLYSRPVSAEEFDRLLEQAYSGSSADPSSGSNR